MLFSGGRGSVAYLGGSVTQARGAGNTAETSWRALFQKYLMREYHRKYYPHIGAIVSGLGGCNSPVGTFLVRRNILSSKPALTFVEYCLNDRHVPDKRLVTKGMEGVIRQLISSDDRSDVILLGAGCNPKGTTPDGQTGPVDHSLHRKIAEHYHLPFIDLQSYIYRRLEERGQNWEEHIAPRVEYDPNYHLNDYGQEIYCQAIVEAFEEQAALFLKGNHPGFEPYIPEPLVSDELQFVKLIDPSRKQKQLTLEGQWEKKPQELVPWYFDNVLIGKPGARILLEFTGTAVMVWALLSFNGLNIKACIDGNELSGIYSRYHLEFGRGFVLAHGMPYGRHLLDLTVDKAVKRHNKLENPSAQIGFLGIAQKS